MAKIDVAKIDGFDGMSDEDKVKALLGYEFEQTAPDNTEVNKLKTALSKSNGEAAEYKRLLREKQTEQERAEAERAEREKQRDEEIAELKAYKRTADNRAKLIAVGVDAIIADSMAKLLPDGVDDTYFDAMKQLIEAQKKALLDENLKKQPGLSVGTPPTTADAKAKEDAQIRAWFGLS